LFFKVHGDKVIIKDNGKISTREHKGNPLKFLRELLNRYKPVTIPGLPRFYGGAVGYLGYEMVRYFEKLPPSPPDDLNLDDAVFVISDSLMILTMCVIPSKWWPALSRKMQVPWKQAMPIPARKSKQ